MEKIQFYFLILTFRENDSLKSLGVRLSVGMIFDGLGVHKTILTNTFLICNKALLMML